MQMFARVVHNIRYINIKKNEGEKIGCRYRVIIITFLLIVKLSNNILNSYLLSNCDLSIFSLL